MWRAEGVPPPRRWAPSLLLLPQWGEVHWASLGGDRGGRGQGCQGGQEPAPGWGASQAPQRWAAEAQHGQGLPWKVPPLAVAAMQQARAAREVGHLLGALRGAHGAGVRQRQEGPCRGGVPLGEGPRRGLGVAHGVHQLALVASLGGVYVPVCVTAVVDVPAAGGPAGPPAGPRGAGPPRAGAPAGARGAPLATAGAPMGGGGGCLGALVAVGVGTMHSLYDRHNEFPQQQTQLTTCSMPVCAYPWD